MGRVQINGETVSEKRGFATEIHSFDYNNSSYVLSLSPLFSLYTLGVRFELIRDDVQLFLCGEKKEKINRKWDIQVCYYYARIGCYWCSDWV